ncbi:MAG TPA: type II toxin-antitoxin system VapC family toxin [Longimicrobiales bacterium]
MKRGTLLDTHAWMWLVFDERHRGSAEAWRDIDECAVTNSLAVSEISFWEVAVQAGKRRLDLGQDVDAWLREAAKAPGIGVVHVDREVLVKSALLDLEQRDPADRILVATALRYGLRLATADESLLSYAAKHPSLQVLDMRP